MSRSPPSKSKYRRFRIEFYTFSFPLSLPVFPERQTLRSTFCCKLRKNIERKSKKKMAAFVSQRQINVEISQEWSDAANSILNTSPASLIQVVFICGAKNSGKTTFSRYLLNTFLTKFVLSLLLPFFHFVIRQFIFSGFSLNFHNFFGFLKNVSAF